MVRRQIVVRLLFLGGNIVLARALAPHVFGIFAIVTFVVQFFSTFSNVGLGAALIQKKEHVSEPELSTAFWFQQGLVGMVAGIVFLAAPLAMRVYPGLPQSGPWLIRAMAVSFLFTSLKTIPSILMERNLSYEKIAWTDIAEQAIYYATVIPLALSGFEVWSFVIATIAQSVVGVALIYRYSEWRPARVFHWPSAKGLISFGIPFQMNDVVNFIKEAITPLFVGIYSGSSAVGYVTWARNFAFAPIVLSEAFTKVSFPAFSRIQDEKELLASTVELSFRCITFVMFPVTTIAFLLGPEITRIVFTEKWLPGITAYYFYCTSPFIIGIMVPMYNAILAMGKSSVLLKLGVLLLFLEWGLGIPLVLRFGYTGIAMNQPVIGFIFFFLYNAVLKKEGVRLSLWKNISPQLFSALFAGILVKGASMLVAVNATTIVLLSIFGILVYLAAIYLIAGPLLREFVNYCRQIFCPMKAA